jgi:translation initiation factor eIF-2B subunit alpha
MKSTEKENLNKLFLYHGNVLGAARTTVMALNALIDTFARLDCENEAIMERYQELAQAIRSTEPRIIPLIHMLEQFEIDITPYLDADVETLRGAAIKILQKKAALIESRVERVVRHGIQFVEDGDGIILHSASTIITSILLQAKQVMMREFSVVVLQLDPVRTPQAAHSLHEAGIPHQVIPAFNLCHYLDRANKIFLGAVSISRDLKVVAPVGTSSTLSLCRYNNIKSYMFANSFHFSHGLGLAQRIRQEETDVATPRTTYHLTSHSHDLVDISLIDVLVDEDGIVDAERLATLTQ